MLILLLACANPDDTGSKTEDTDTVLTDVDGDGYGEDDCNDASPAVHPGASETCDGVDNDCDGAIDEDAVDMSTTYADNDGDGYGDADSATTDCAGAGATNASDCDDSDGSIHPGADEACNDPIDRDCDGSAGGEDADGDGYLGCDDCDDTRSEVNPGATEVCDQFDRDEDCSGAADDDDPGTDTSTESDWYRDFDNDDHGDPDSAARSSCDAPTGYVATADDCDDHDDGVYPGAIEICDDENVDEDCSGAADDEDPGVDADSLLAWYGDGDADGYGGGAPSAWACEAPDGLTGDATDCDDADGTVNPGADEVCDTLDNDCDRLVDDDDTVKGAKNTFYDDDDGDGYGDAGTTISRCTAPPGWADNPDDCDDNHATAHPGAAEVCDDADVDEDCDGLVDDEDSDHTGDLSLYADGDGDGYGGDSFMGTACNAPAGQAGNSDDCDDENAARNPGATEICDDADVDEDCDGAADDLDSGGASGSTTLYQDGDNDGYGNKTTVGTGCGGTDGTATTDNDCNDRNAAISPGAPEICDGSDNDCDGLTDDSDTDVTGTYWYTDTDGDGYGDDATAFESCTEIKDTVSLGGDCDEADAAVNPGATEACDGIDNDCDDLVDADDPSAGAATWYKDTDRDGYGDPATGAIDCGTPSGYTLDGTDCDDLRASIHPGASESCDGRDNDCSGVADDGLPLLYADADGDGFGDMDSAPTCDGTIETASDCDDTDATVNPDGVEIPGDDVDDNCDGVTETLTKTMVTTDTVYADSEYILSDMRYEGVTITVGPNVFYQCNRCSFIESTIVVETDTPTTADKWSSFYIYNSFFDGSLIETTAVDGGAFANHVEIALDHTTWVDAPGDAITATQEGSSEVAIYLTASVFYGTFADTLATTGTVGTSSTDVVEITGGTTGYLDLSYTPPRPDAGSPLLDTGSGRILVGDYWDNRSTPSDIGAVER